MAPAPPTWGYESMGHTIPHPVGVHGHEEVQRCSLLSYMPMSVTKALA